MEENLNLISINPLIKMSLFTPDGNVDQTLCLNEKQLHKIYSDIGYKFNDHNILIISLTRKSALKEETDKVLNSYERLEYLGDSVIKLLISEYLFENFPMNTEGELTRKRNHLESNKFLAEISNSLNLCGYLNADIAESKLLLNYKLQADLFESLIGAIFIDSDKDFNILRKITYTLLFSKYKVESDFKNKKNKNRKNNILNSNNKNLNYFFPDSYKGNKNFNDNSEKQKNVKKQEYNNEQCKKVIIPLIKEEKKIKNDFDDIEFQYPSKNCQESFDLNKTFLYKDEKNNIEYNAKFQDNPDLNYNNNKKRKRKNQQNKKKADNQNNFFKENIQITNFNDSNLNTGKKNALIEKEKFINKNNSNEKINFIKSDILYSDFNNKVEFRNINNFDIKKNILNNEKIFKNPQEEKHIELDQYIINNFEFMIEKQINHLKTDKISGENLKDLIEKPNISINDETSTFNTYLINSLFDYLLNTKNKNLNQLNNKSFAIFSDEEIKNYENLMNFDLIFEFFLNCPYYNKIYNNENTLKNIYYAIDKIVYMHKLNNYELFIEAYYIYLNSKACLKKKNFKDFSKSIEQYDYLFKTNKKNYSEINYLELQLKYLYAEYLYKIKNFKETEVILDKIRFLIFQSNEYCDKNFEMLSNENLILLLDLEIKQMNIILKMNRDNYYLESSVKVMLLIEFFEKTRLIKIVNYDKILLYKFMLLKRKYKKSCLDYNMIYYSNEFEIAISLLKEILEIDRIYLIYSKYFLKDILEFQKLFFYYFKMLNK